MLMNPQDIKASLEQLLALSDGWVRQGGIPSIERDLALEKLRRIYEDLLIAAPGAAAMPSSIVADGGDEPVSINLDEVLSVDISATEEKGAGEEPESAPSRPEPIHEQVRPEVKDVDEKLVGVNVSPQPVDGGIEPEKQPMPEEPAQEPAEPESESESAPEVEVEWVFGDESSEEPEVSVAASEQDAEVEVELIFADDAEQEAADAVPAANGEAETEAQPQSADEPQIASASGLHDASVLVSETNASLAAEEEADANHKVVAPVETGPAESVVDAGQDRVRPDSRVASHSENKDKKKPSVEEHRDDDSEHEAVAHPADRERTMVQSLFGPEDPEELRRHRTKQRILMSLYDMPETGAGASPSTTSHRESGYPALQAEARQVASEEPVADTSSVTESEFVLAPRTIEAAESLPAFDETVTEADDATMEVVTVCDTDEEGPLQHEVPEASAEETVSVVELSRDGNEPEAASGADNHPGVQSAEEESVAGSVLGEVINHDVRTLADELGTPRRDVASELARRETVDDLRKAIGINDKFLLIRDLFGGEADAYERAIDALNAFDNLDDCLIHIAEHYAWNPNSDGAKLLMELLERKLS